MNAKTLEVWFTPATAWEAEGGRSALVSCRKCGSALLLNAAADFDVLDLHIRRCPGVNRDLNQ